MTDTLTPTSALTRLGWTDDDPYPATGTALAHVVVHHGTRYEVLAVGSDGTLTAHTADVAPTLPVTPVAGDWVELGPDGRAITVAARRAVLTRTGSTGQGRQVLAANIDTVLIVVPLAGGLNAAMVERLSVMAWDSGAQPVLVLSKSDTTDDGGPRDAAAAELLSPDVPVLPVSVRTGEGLDTLRAHLGPGTTAVMLGPSGAGKISLLNALEGTSEAVASVGRSGAAGTPRPPAACTR